MTWVAVAVAGAAVVGSVISSQSAKKAAKTAAGAAGDATQSQLAMYEQSREDAGPWREAGAGAVNALWGTPGTPATTTQGAPIYGTSGGTPGVATGSGWGMEMQYDWESNSMKPVPVHYIAGDSTAGLMGGGQQQITGYQPSTTTPGTPGTQGLIQKGPGQFVPEKEPGYKFGYQEFVENPTLKLASATGKLGSGATLKALTRYASDYASTKYDNFLDRYYKSLDPYFRMAGLGSNVTVAGGNQASETGRGVAATTLAGGQATAAGQLGSAYPYANLSNRLAELGMANYKPTTQSGGSSLGTYSTTPYNLPDYAQ